YHQWSGKAVPGFIDKSGAVEGEAAFKFTVPGETGGRYMAREGKIDAPDQDYGLSFSLMAKDLPANAGRVRLAIDGSGFLGSESGKTDLVTLSGSQDWKGYAFFVPADKLGETKKVTIFFYHDKPAEGVMGIDAVSFRRGTADDVPASDGASGG